MKVPNWALLHLCKIGFEYVYPPRFPSYSNFWRNWAKTGGRTWCHPSRPLYVAPWIVEVRLTSVCTPFATLWISDCCRFPFLVQGKRNLDKKFQKNLIEFGGLPPDHLESDRKATPRVSYEPSGGLQWWKNRVHTTSGFSGTRAVVFLMQKSAKIFK